MAVDALQSLVSLFASQPDMAVIICQTLGEWTKLMTSDPNLSAVHIENILYEARSLEFLYSVYATFDIQFRLSKLKFPKGQTPNFPVHSTELTIFI